MSRGIWTSETEFVSFSELAKPKLTGDQIATRQAVGELGAFLGYLPNPDPVLRRTGKSIQTYRDLLIDPLVKGARRRRRAAVVGMERGFDRGHAPVRVLKCLEAIFADLPLNVIIRGLVDGGFFGYGVAEVVWGKVGSYIVPVDVIVKPPEWFAFNGDDQLLLRRMGSVGGDPLPDRKFIVVGNNRTYQNPYGEPDLASVFWAVAFKRGGLRFWSKFVEKYGTPWAVGKLPRSAGKPETDDLADKLGDMVQDAVAVIPDDASVELLTTSTASNTDSHERLLMYCSREISIALLGNNQTVEMQSNKASAAEGAKVEDELRDDDAEMVCDGFKQLVKWIVELNFAGAVAPTYKLWEQESIDEVRAGRDKSLADTGVVFTKQYFMRAYNLEDGDIASVGKALPVGVVKDPSAGPLAGLLNDPEETDLALSEGDQVPPDQAAIDAAIEHLPADQIQAAMATMLRPALDAVASAQSPDQVLALLAEAFPKMDSSELERLMGQAFLVADAVGHGSVIDEAAGGT
jgi:phage gp29-like protein